MNQAKDNGINKNGFEDIEQQLLEHSPETSSAPNLKDPPLEQLQRLINLFKEGKFQKVLKDATQLSQKFNTSFVLYNILGAANKELGKLDTAIQAFEKALTIKPDYVEAINNMGIAFKEQGKLEEAIKEYEKVFTIEANCFEAHNNIGNALKEQGNLEKALESYEMAIMIKPDYAEAYNNMGIILKEQGRIKEALEAYNNAIAFKPNYAEPYNKKGIILKEQGKLDEAINVYKKVLSIKPDFAEALNNMGNVLKEQGKLENAIDAYKKTLSLKPDFPETSTNLAILLFESRKFKEAAKIFSADDSAISQSYLLKCYYEQDEQTKFYNQVDYLVERGENNCVIGSFISRAKIRYGIKRKNPFCGEPLKYVFKTDLTEVCDFKNIFVKAADDILRNDKIQHKSQGHLTNGTQTSGNVFTQAGSFTDKMKNIIYGQLEKYREHFKSSDEGLIKGWPSDYTIFGWLVSMKSGGELAAHIHDEGWITGSIYINVPPKTKPDSGNLVVSVGNAKDTMGSPKDIRSLDVVTGSLCLFPSSLLHYTIPFEGDEERVVLAFDMIPKY